MFRIGGKPSLSHAAVFGDACDIFNGVKKLRGAAVAAA